ncbi:MAG: hypothetical protein HOV81_06355 [Kofleriaceae bacterium]|nr:hypothetical protein [Kofleriaceae bacterium]
MKKLFTTFLPTLFAGGLIFGSALGQADDGRMPMPPSPPSAPVPPRAPKPPKAPKAGGGVSVQIHDGEIQVNGVNIAGLAGQVDGQIAGAIAQIDSDPNIPPKVRAKLKAKLERIRGKLSKRLAKLDVKDLDQLKDQLESIGDEIGSEMDDFGREMDEFGQGMDEFGKGMEEWGKEFGKEMGKWGEQFGKDVQSQVMKGLAKGKQWHIQVDDDDDDEDMPAGMPDMDDDDMHDAVRGLGQLNLSQQQRQQLKSLRADSDRKVEQAKRNLERESDNLKRQLENPNASEADIARSIDAVAQQEAAIRKARILAWVNARRLLDDSQRRQVEGAAKGRSH